jgi:hypothetical protein
VEISRLQRKEKYLKITKTTAIQQKNGKLLGRSRKDPYSPHRGNFCRPEGELRKNCL